MASRTRHDVTRKDIFVRCLRDAVSFNSRKQGSMSCFKKCNGEIDDKQVTCGGTLVSRTHSCEDVYCEFDAVSHNSGCEDGSFGRPSVEHENDAHLGDGGGCEGVQVNSVEGTCCFSGVAGEGGLSADQVPLDATQFPAQSGVMSKGGVGCRERFSKARQLSGCTQSLGYVFRGRWGVGGEENEAERGDADNRRHYFTRRSALPPVSAVGADYAELCGTGIERTSGLDGRLAVALRGEDVSSCGANVLLTSDVCSRSTDRLLSDVAQSTLGVGVFTSCHRRSSVFSRLRGNSRRKAVSPFTVVGETGRTPPNDSTDGQGGSSLRSGGRVTGKSAVVVVSGCEPSRCSTSVSDDQKGDGVVVAMGRAVMVSEVDLTNSFKNLCTSVDAVVEPERSVPSSDDGDRNTTAHLSGDLFASVGGVDGVEPYGGVMLGSIEVTSLSAAIRKNRRSCPHVDGCNRTGSRVAEAAVRATSASCWLHLANDCNHPVPVSTFRPIYVACSGGITAGDDVTQSTTSKALVCKPPVLLSTFDSCVCDGSLAISNGSSLTTCVAGSWAATDIGCQGIKDPLQCHALGCGFILPDKGMNRIHGICVSPVTTDFGYSSHPLLVSNPEKLNDILVGAVRTKCSLSADCVEDCVDKNLTTSSAVVSCRCLSNSEYDSDCSSLLGACYSNSLMSGSSESINSVFDQHSQSDFSDSDYQTVTSGEVSGTCGNRNSIGAPDYRHCNRLNTYHHHAFHGSRPLCVDESCNVSGGGARYDSSWYQYWLQSAYHCSGYGFQGECVGQEPAVERCRQGQSTVPPRSPRAVDDPSESVYSPSCCRQFLPSMSCNINSHPRGSIYRASSRRLPSDFGLEDVGAFRHKYPHTESSGSVHEARGSLQSDDGSDCVSQTSDPAARAGSRFNVGDSFSGNSSKGKSHQHMHQALPLPSCASLRHQSPGVIASRPDSLHSSHQSVRLCTDQLPALFPGIRQLWREPSSTDTGGAMETTSGGAVGSLTSCHILAVPACTEDTPECPQDVRYAPVVTCRNHRTPWFLLPPPPPPQIQPTITTISPLDPPCCRHPLGHRACVDTCHSAAHSPLPSSMSSSPEFAHSRDQRVGPAITPPTPIVDVVSVASCRADRRDGFVDTSSHSQIPSTESRCHTHSQPPSSLDSAVLGCFSNSTEGCGQRGSGKDERGNCLEDDSSWVSPVLGVVGSKTVGHRGQFRSLHTRCIDNKPRHTSSGQQHTPSRRVDANVCRDRKRLRLSELSDDAPEAIADTAPPSRGGSVGVGLGNTPDSSRKQHMCSVRWNKGDGGGGHDAALFSPLSGDTVWESGCGDSLRGRAKRCSGRHSDFRSLNVEAFFKTYTTRFIDTHCHLDFLFTREPYAGSFTSYRAKHGSTFPSSFEGCVAVFCNPRTFTSEAEWKPLVEEEGVWLAMGCHPKNAAQYDEQAESGMRRALLHRKAVALGEIGLDYSRHYGQYADVQKEVFVRQIKIAIKMKLPLVIHCRDAEHDCLEILKRHVPTDHKIHCHCFTASYTSAVKWMSLFPNLFIGLTPLVTYRSAVETHDVAARMPLDKLLLETDAPYFLPRGFDGPLSHPGMALAVAVRVAELRGIGVEEVLTQARHNTRNMYGI